MYQIDNDSEDEFAVTECVTPHEWFGLRDYCSVCGVERGEETNR